MRRIGAFLAVWIALFGITLSVGAVARRGAKPRNPQDEMEQQAQEALAELKGKARKNAFALLSDGSQNEAFEVALSANIREHAEGLRACRLRIRERLKRASEYFEISFDPELLGLADQSSTLQQRVRLTNVVLERATVALNSEEEQCLIRAFEGMEFDTPTLPSGRFAETFCFVGKYAEVFAKKD